MGMTPLDPTPTGMWSNSDWASCSFTGWTSPSSRFVLSSRTPQLMSNPTPPGEPHETSGQRRFTATRNVRDLERTWRHHGVWVAHVEGRHVSDRKSVSRVDVREPDGPLWDNQTLSFQHVFILKSVKSIVILTWTIPGSAATFPICFMAGRNPPTPGIQQKKQNRD